jgi:hypothetical protein
MLIRFIAEYDDGSKEPLDIDSYDLRSGDWVARIIAGERQREPIGFPQLKDGKIVRVYRDPAISYLRNARLDGEPFAARD